MNKIIELPLGRFIEIRQNVWKQLSGPDLFKKIYEAYNKDQ